MVLAEERYHEDARVTRALPVGFGRNARICAGNICLGDLTASFIFGHLIRGNLKKARPSPGANSVRRIAIVGGGQSGLQLALGLLENKYEVLFVSNRPPDQILSGRVPSSQFMFHDSLQNERDLGINFWEKECPITEGIAFSVPGPDGGRALFWEAKLDHY